MSKSIFSFLVLYILHGVLLNSEVVRNHLGSRTPYRFISNKNDSRIEYPDCKDTKIWMIIRHGTRMPSTKDIKKINTTLKALKYEILRNGQGELSKEQFENFQKWNPELKIEEERHLTLEGQDEMILLAERMQKRFSSVIKQEYDNNTFLFRYTATQRTQQSARYFTNGLFEKTGGRDVIFSPASEVDPVLRFYKHCDKWQKQVKKNPNTYKEKELYGVSKEMNDTLKSVSKRLGFDKVLDLDTVVLMYKTCGYETSWNKYFTSPWCYAFDKHDAETLEYYYDLKHYWLDGYGYELTYQPACVSIKNMFENFSKKEEPSATFLFAHSGTVLKILTYLGLYKPESHLRGVTNVKDRTWRTSQIDCFATNLAFVLFECRDGDHILMMHQEHIVKLPMCDTELCPLKKLKEYFHKSIDECEFNDMCRLKPNDEL